MHLQLIYGWVSSRKWLQYEHRKPRRKHLTKKVRYSYRPLDRRMHHQQDSVPTFHQIHPNSQRVAARHKICRFNVTEENQQDGLWIFMIN